MSISGTHVRLITSFALTAAIAALLVPGTASASANSASAAGNRAAGRVATATTTSNLVDHGGKVLAHSRTVAIFWGTWSNQAAFTDLKNGMDALLNGFVGSSYLNTATQYMRGTTATTSYGGALFDTSTPPNRAPSTNSLAAEVAKVLTNNAIATDPNTVYLVYTSNLPKVNYCAWHSFGTVNGVQTQIAYLPFTATTCYVSGDTYSHNNWLYSTKALADSTAHEFMEAITDPLTSSSTYGWIDGHGSEIGDKCNYNYLGTVTLTSTTAVPSNTWQIQSEWSNAISGCAQTT